jgi:aspartyl-tRNA(Asn)/glutamyl-tRNA(Gln) amidotransferase subunit B
MREWLTLLRTTLRAIGVSDVNMEEGSLRCDANVSLRPRGSTTLGTKTELKNMNSFRFLAQGVKAEIERQADLLRCGQAVIQETLHFDPASGRLTALRSKEAAHDYRYFPEPDLVPLVVHAAMLEAARAQLPELPSARADRFEQKLGLPRERARDLAFRTELANFYEATLAAASTDFDAVAVANWIPALVERIGSDTDPADSKVTPAALASLVAMVVAKSVNQRAARDVLTILVESGGDPVQVVEREGLGAIDAQDSGLAEIVAAAITADPGAADKVRGGNMKATGPLVGYVMRETKGRADGGEITRLIREQLGLP